MNASLRRFSPSAIAFSTLFEPVIAAMLGAILREEGLEYSIW